MNFKKGQKVRVYRSSNSVWSDADMVVSKPPKDGIVICDHPSHGSGGFWVDQLYALPETNYRPGVLRDTIIQFLGIILTGFVIGTIVESHLRVRGDTFLKPFVDVSYLIPGDNVEYRYQDSVNYCQEMKVLSVIVYEGQDMVFTRGKGCTLPGTSIPGVYAFRYRDLVKVHR